MNIPKRIVIIGATSAIAEHCARLWAAEQPQELVLVGRNAEKLALIAADLRVRSANSRISPMQCDFNDPARIALLAENLCRSGSIDIVLIAHGMLSDQQRCQDDPNTNAQALSINGISPVLFAEAFVKQMLPQPEGGCIAIIGSVAGDRGRKSNYVYGAAKGMVSRYAEGLQHRLSQTKLRVLLIKPGPTDTPMTAHLKQQGARLAPVDAVAKDIVNAIRTGKLQLYTPRKWVLIMAVIRNLPRFIFNRMDI